MARKTHASLGHRPLTSVSSPQPSPDCVLTVGRNGRVTGADQPALDLLGYSLDRLVGKPLAAILGSSNERNRPAASLADLLAEPAPVALTLYARDDRPIPVLFHSTQLRMEPDGDIHVCHLEPQINRDLKEWKVVQADLLRQTREQFMANMNHELRTPLTGILGMAQILEESDLTRDQRDQLETITQCGQNLLEFVDRVLEFKDIRNPQAQPHTEAFCVSDLVHEMLDRYEPSFNTKNLNCTVQVDEGVPRAVLGDATKLKRVLDVLLDNAVKFTEQGHVGLRLVRETRRGNRFHLRISIRDTGIGIPASKQALIFEPFQQGDGSLTRRYGGGGLGLSLARELVRAMGGELWVDSDPGWGSEFHVSLPLEIAPAGPTDHDLVSRM